MAASKQIEFLARGVAVQDGRLLVCRTADAPLVYLPGGHVEFGETARTALSREIMEELGCTADVRRFLGAVQHAFLQQGEQRWEINLVFEMRVQGLEENESIRPMESHLSFEWIELGGLAGSTLEPAVMRSCLPAWLRDEPVERWVEPSGCA